MLAKYERLLKAKEKKLYANYKQSYRQLDKDVREILSELDSIEGQLNLDDWHRQLLHHKTGVLMGDLYTKNHILLSSTFDEIVDTTKNHSLKAFKGHERLIAIAKPINNTNIVNKSIAGLNWADRMKHSSNVLRYDFIRITAGGIEQGDSYSKIANKLADRYMIDVGKANTLARTEGHRIFETTKYETMASVNEEVKLLKTWHSVHDEKVRSSHSSLDGTQIAFDDYFISPSGSKALRPGEFGDPAEDIYCRCYLSYELKLKGK